MRRGVFRLLACGALFASGLMSLGSAAARPVNFIFLGGDGLASAGNLLKRPDIAGFQVVYSWRQLEPQKDHYDFSAIDADLKRADAAHKKLFVQVQDRFFSRSARNVPEYLLHDPAYHGGLAPQTDHAGEGTPVGHGWVTRQWDPAVRDRFQHLLTALGKRFDGRIYGLNLPETAFDMDEKHPPAGFSCDGYFHAELSNMAAARAAFPHSHVVQYVNFWPCEWNDSRHYMSRLFAFAIQHHIGLGGPDVVPWRKTQMKNSYPFFHADHDRLPLVAMAIQGPTLTYTDPKTGKPFTRTAITAFATDYLGADILFWTRAAPWLKQSPQ